MVMRAREVDLPIVVSNILVHVSIVEFRTQIETMFLRLDRIGFAPKIEL